MADRGVVVFRTPRERMVDALAVFRGLSMAATRGQAVLGFRDKELIVEIGGRVVHINGEGVSIGEARVPSRLVLTLARSMPAGDPVEFRAVPNAMHINGMVASCTWQTDRERPVPMPINATLSYLMAVGLRHAGSDIAKSGSTEVVRKAEARAEKVMARAAKILEPLEVDPEDLKRLVYASIRRRWPAL